MVYIGQNRRQCECRRIAVKIDAKLKELNDDYAAARACGLKEALWDVFGRKHLLDST